MAEYIKREEVIKLIREDKVEITPNLLTIAMLAASNGYSVEDCYKAINNTCDRHIKEIRNLPAADVVERMLFDERIAEYQEALDKANEKLAYITGTDDYHYDLEYGREQLNSYVSALVYEKTKERKKGKWEFREEFFAYGIAHFDCSICGESVLERTRFCPNCGAEMLPTQMSGAGEAKDVEL